METQQNAIQPTRTKGSKIISLLIAVLLVASYPLGLIVMWIFSGWSKKTKVLATLLPIPLLVLVVIAVVKISLIGAPRHEEIPAPQNQGWLLYADGNLGYSISYPRGWSYFELSGDIENSSDGVSFHPPWLEQVAIDVTVSKLKPPVYDLRSLMENLSPALLNLYPEIRDIAVSGISAKQLVSGTGIMTFIIKSRSGVNYLYTISIKTDAPTTLSQRLGIYQRMLETLQLN